MRFGAKAGEITGLSRSPLACICRIHRAAIENPDFSAWSTEARYQTLTEKDSVEV
jgi:hypothetical protein